MKWLQRGIIFLSVGVFALALFSPFCNALFRCGCQAFWAAGSKLCNVHMMGVPHCPFCATAHWGKLLPRGFILISQAIVVFIPRRLSWVSRLGLGILVFLFIGTTIGFIFRLWTHYPAFLG
jgi:hypothetical protein